MQCVHLGESFPTEIWSQKSASIQPRTNPDKFAVWSGRARPDLGSFLSLLNLYSPICENGTDYHIECHAQYHTYAILHIQTIYRTQQWFSQCHTYTNTPRSILLQPKTGLRKIYKASLKASFFQENACKRERWRVVKPHSLVHGTTISIYFATSIKSYVL